MKSILASLIISTVIYSACSTPSNPNIPIQTDTAISMKRNDIVFTLTLSKTRFQRAESLTATFEILNKSQSDVAFQFSNVQQLGFQLIDSIGIVVLLQPQIVSPALSAFTIAVEEKKTFTVLQSLSNVPVGKYRFDVSLLNNNSPTLAQSITVNWSCCLTSRSSWRNKRCGELPRVAMKNKNINSRASSLQADSAVLSQLSSVR